MKAIDIPDSVKVAAAVVAALALVVTAGVLLAKATIKAETDRTNAAIVAAAPVKAADAGQALAQDAVKTLDAAVKRNDVTIHIQQENARALAEAPGADAPVDPEFARRLRDGLCRYAAYAADPGCAEVRGRDPAELP